MKANCNANTCKYNNEDICTKEEIELNNDGTGVICLSYKESDEYILNSFNVIESKIDNIPCKIIIIKNIFVPIIKIQKCIEKIYDMEKENIIYDCTLRNSIFSTNRYYLYHNNTCNCLDKDHKDELKKITCDYLRNNSKVLNNSIIPIVYQNKIIQGEDM